MSGGGDLLPLPWPTRSEPGLRRFRSPRPAHVPAQPLHNQVGILCFPEPGSAQRTLRSGSGGAHSSWMGALAPTHCPRPCPPSPASQLTFLYRRAQRPPPRALPFLEETVSDGICGSRRKQSGGLRRGCRVDPKGPGPRLEKGCLGSCCEAGGPSCPAPPPGAWPRRAPRGAPP